MRSTARPSPPPEKGLCALRPRRHAVPVRLGPAGRGRRRAPGWRRSRPSPGRAVDGLRMDLVSALANALFLQDRPLEGAEAVRAAEPRLLRSTTGRARSSTAPTSACSSTPPTSTPRPRRRRGEAIALARAEGDRIGELVLLNNLAFSLHDVGRVAAALEPLGEACGSSRCTRSCAPAPCSSRCSSATCTAASAAMRRRCEFLQTGLERCRRLQPRLRGRRAQQPGTPVSRSRPARRAASSTCASRSRSRRRRR